MLDGLQQIENSAVDFERLREWMDSLNLGSGVISEITPLGGGTQNIIIKFRREKIDFVLRRPSLNLRANSNETMMREARVLNALTHTEVPHPRLIAACADTTVLGAAFYLMEPVKGFNAPGGLPSLYAADATIRHRMGLAMAKNAALLGAVDYEKVGLSDFGKPDGFLDRQTDRWRSQLESYQEYTGWPGPNTLPNVDDIQTWLVDNVPVSSYRPGIMHGDYHIANVLFYLDSPEVAAIVDWELATIGDPLLDLGWLLATWPDEYGNVPDTGLVVELQSSFPTANELIAHYGRTSTRDLTAVPWYVVLACYKLGIILEGTYARACARLAPVGTGNRLHAASISLFKRARRWIEVS
jgi:aminoglycoside phosphotransferase (APT) family kinase protein